MQQCHAFRWPCRLMTRRDNRAAVGFSPGMRFQIQAASPKRCSILDSNNNPLSVPVQTLSAACLGLVHSRDWLPVPHLPIHPVPPGGIALFTGDSPQKQAALSQVHRCTALGAGDGGARVGSPHSSEGSPRTREGAPR